MTAEHPAVVAVANGLTDAFDRRDWDRFENLIDPAAVLLDHRRASWGRLDRGAYVELTKQLPAMVPDAALTIPEVVRLSARGGVFILAAMGTTEAGSLVEFAWAIVAEMHDGTVRRLEYFDAEDADAAVARFEALEAHDGT